MALLRGFVFEVNRRALFAVLAIAISVSYALVAGAAVTGLQDAQETLARDLQETDLVATMDGEAFGPVDLPGQPDVGLAVHRTDSGHVIFTTRVGAPTGSGNDTVLASPSSELQAGEEVPIDGRTYTVAEDQLPKGASLGWLGVSPRTFEELGGRAPPNLHVAVYEDGSQALAEDLTDRGFETHRAPGALGFYTAGASELVSAVRVTVLASTVVVALLTSGFVALELHAKRQTLSTLQLYAGAGRVRSLAAGRGLALLAAGHLLALGATVGLLAVVGRVGALSLTLDPGFAGLALAATFGGGLLGLIPPLRQAAQPLEAKDLADEEPPRWAPRWARPTLASWRILVPLLAAAIVLSASLGVVFGVVDLPGQLFGTGGSDVVADTSGNPLRGQVSMFMGLHLDEVDGFETASPEIFAPTHVRGKPVMVRGVDWPSLTALDTVTLEDGRQPHAPGEGVAGARLARQLDLALGDRLTLPGAYVPTVETVEIVGVAAAPGILDDELLVPLPTARALTGLPSDKVNLVRYKDAREVDPITGQQEPFPTGIEVTELRLRPGDPVPYEPATVEADLVNFGATSTTRTLTLRVNGQPVETANVELPARDGSTYTFGFRTPAQGLQRLEVNPTLEPQGGEPAYRIDAPKISTVNHTFQVTVTDRAGDPAQGVRLHLEAAANTTDADGHAQLTPQTAGNQTLVASGPEGRAATPIFTVYASDLHRSRLRFESIQGPVELIQGEPWQGAVVLVNIGGEPFRGPIPLPVNDTTLNVSNVRLDPGERQRSAIELDLPAGTHTIGPGDKALTLRVREQGQAPSPPGGTGDQRSVEELLQLRREQARLRSNAEPEATRAFLGDTFENLNAALTVVTLATVLHAGLITLVAVHREIEQRSPTLGTMAAMGADRRDVRGVALREYVLLGVVAALAGTLVGLLVAWIGAQVGLISGFGHALLPRADLGFLLRVAGASLLTTLAAAVLSVEAIHGRRPGELLTEGPARTQRPPLDTLLEGSP